MQPALKDFRELSLIYASRSAHRLTPRVDNHHHVVTIFRRGGFLCQVTGHECQRQGAPDGNFIKIPPWFLFYRPAGRPLQKKRDVLAQRRADVGPMALHLPGAGPTQLAAILSYWICVSTTCCIHVYLAPDFHTPLLPSLRLLCPRRTPSSKIHFIF